MRQWSFKPVGRAVVVLSVIFIICLMPVKSLFAMEGKFWHSLIPSHTKLQLAGGIGTVSASIGWTYGKKEQWETDFFLGYLPKYSSSRHKGVMTLKQTYNPWHITLGNCSIWNRISFSPLRTGCYLSTITGSSFWTREPNMYPDKYYKFASRRRINIFLGQDFTLHFGSISNSIGGKRGRTSKKSLSIYYELHTYDLMAISAFSNSELDFFDYIKLAVGLKYKFK